MSSSTLSDWLWDRAAQLGVRHVFVMPSGQVNGLAASLTARDCPQAIVTTTELGAGYMAEGQARVTCQPGMVLVGGGPGTATVLPSAVNARLERTPVVYLTGAEDDATYPFARFQDTGSEGSRDAALMALASGHSRTMTPGTAIDDWSELAARVADHMPIHLALSPATQSSPAPEGAVEARPRKSPSGTDAPLERIAALYADARSPVLVLGQRLMPIRHGAALDRLMRTWGGAIVTTVAAAGMLPDDTPGYLGNFGHGGQPAANACLAADGGLFLFIGGGPGQRDGVDWSSRAGSMARIDIAGSVDPRWPAPEVLTSDLEAGIDALVARLVPIARVRRPEAEPFVRSQTVELPLDAFLIEAQRHLPPDIPVFVDAGTHRRGMARLWQGGRRGMVHSSAEHAPMGWGIAAAIGAALALDAPVLCVTGDGSMRLLGQEIATAARYGARVIFLVANNGGFASLASPGKDPAMVGHFGEADLMDWAAYAAVHGVQGCRVEDVTALGPALRSGLALSAPCVIDVRLPSVCPARPSTSAA